MESDAPVYNTPEGQELVKLKDFQMQGILITLDDRTLVATMATGSGKTGSFAFSMIAMLAIPKKQRLSRKILPWRPSYLPRPYRHGEDILLICVQKLLTRD